MDAHHIVFELEEGKEKGRKVGNNWNTGEHGLCYTHHLYHGRDNYAPPKKGTADCSLLIDRRGCQMKENVDCKGSLCSKIVLRTCCMMQR